ncbi:MAG TPA: 7-cyano-7-deazaguanine synthase QueC [bacterium]|jgi:7-cyano-7-deazaguanine synthase
MSTPNPRAVVLLSGGIDSTTTAAVARDQGFDLYALTIYYGQRHAVELEAARKVAESLHVIRHILLNIDLSVFGGSALTADIEVPKERTAAQMGEDIPITYVPARNTVFLSLALGWAETLGAQTIFIGANAVDYSGYPDCRPDYLAAFEQTANLATKAGREGKRFSIQAPLLMLTKAEIIRWGARLGVDYSLTHSCYDPTPEGLACARCDSCLIRSRGFSEAGVPDPTHYVSSN